MPPSRNPALALAAIAEDLRAHAPCGQEPCQTCTNFVPGEGDPRARVVLIGEAPGAAEDRCGRPFVGRAGRLLDELLSEAGLEREQVYITNTVKARPPGNRDPKPAEVEHHLPWLRAELEAIRPALIVPLGRHALGHFVAGAKITQVAGTVIQREGARIFPMLHPAAALHNQSLRGTLVEHARALGHHLTSDPKYRGGVPTLSA